MIKKLRLYQIGFFIITFAFITLCAYMGITAIQKSLTLNLKFNATPEIYCKLAVGETVLFDNKTLEVHPLSTLSGNTLTFDASVFSSDLGVTTFNLTITNYSTTLNDIGVTFENATISNNANNSNVITLGNSETLQITPTGIVEVTMKKVVPINLTLSAGVSIDYSKSNIFYDNGYYAPINEDLLAVIELDENYSNPQYSINGALQNQVEDYTIIINMEDISETLSINVTAKHLVYSIRVYTSENDFDETYSVPYGTEVLTINKMCWAVSVYLDGVYQNDQTILSSWFKAEGVHTSNVTTLRILDWSYLENVSSIVFYLSNGDHVGCFPSDTIIATQYGYKKIQDVQVGDVLWTYNEANGEFELKKVYFTRVVEILTEVINLGFGNESLTVTHNHEFLTKNRGWVSAKELTFDDVLITNGAYLQITSYETEVVKDYYYNFSVEDNHNYLVLNKNIIVDDFYCQQQRWNN